MSWTIFKRSLIVAVITFLLDFLFHYFLTNPLESLTYFVIKFLLSFFVAAGLFSFYPLWKKSRSSSKIFNQNNFILLLTGLIFSTLMSVYYRAWELGEAGVPFGSRAPDILSLSRESILFALAWWLGHALFFVVGVIIANRLIKTKS
ncbi:MAG TPA: hypothetical protein VJA23_05910 [Candidatus Nanoarchaeia archaeon]|nr:hypothetical protein [Candidatus Nanoarchaeia archaeon]